jgi:hypothetical protein
VSDFRFVPAADFGAELLWDKGLELCPASLADDLVPAILRSFLHGQTRREAIPRAQWFERRLEGMNSLREDRLVVGGDHRPRISTHMTLACLTS